MSQNAHLLIPVMDKHLSLMNAEIELQMGFHLMAVVVKCPVYNVTIFLPVEMVINKFFQKLCLRIMTSWVSYGYSDI
jgi:hypothetical protein